MAIFGAWGKETKAAAEAHLLEAATTGDAALVEKLLKKGASPNCNDADGMAPLHHAAYHGHMAIITALIGANADVNAQEPSGRTPLMLACSTPVEQANTVDILLNAGANPNLSYTSGENVAATPLHLAVFTGKTAAVKSLLSKGAKTEAKAGDGSTPLHAAAAGGNGNIVALLLAAKADTAETTNEGLTALHLAAANGHLPIVKQLIARKVQIDARDASGQTPLHRVSRPGFSGELRV